MKKSLSLLAAFLVAGMWSAPVQAADHYVSAMAGMSWFQDSDIEHVYADTDYKDVATVSFDSGLTAVGAIGCDYGSTRLEAEIGYQKNDVETDSDYLSGDVQVLSLMANGFYDIDLGGVDLYAMAGVGVAQVNVDIDGERYSYRYQEYIPTNYEASEVTLAYQVGAGLAIPVGDGVMIDARYRYFATTDFTAGDDGAASWIGSSDYNTNVSSHSALLGLRVNL
ncbi:MAG: porin family protein [Chlorobium limicola]|uniref:outer membrane protein n=1 Tax=Chlorobium limicola TaxID=1092 RepID=UPI0023F35359|nr:outer membrane beta-barrel protein [Chlorobium limicola]NTV20695.1 porin family protein [Chlorobium limicola]